MTIFDMVTAPELSAYWTELTQDRDPYIGEELFPNDKKIGITLKWIKGAKGLPVVLKTSAYDVHSIPRPRIGFDRLSADMPYFKESTYIDEELSLDLAIMLETGNQAYIDSVLRKVFDDETRLLEGASASRERMRMQALTTGVVSMSANGQEFVFDYGIDHKGDAEVNWSEVDTADPLEDIRLAKEQVENETGAVLTRAICDGVTWKNLRNNLTIKKNIFVLSDGQGSVSDARLRQHILDEVGVSVVVNNKRYQSETGDAIKYVPSNTFVLFPEGALGSTWFGTTPHERDLMSSGVANVSIVDTGVAITTVQKTDPVNVETIVSMVCLPSFERASEVFILDTEAK